MPRVKCRFCGEPTLLVMNFGPMPIANYFRPLEQSSPAWFELVTRICESCGLFQLENQPDPDVMFNEDYPFFTGLSSTMTKHFQGMVNSVLNSSEKKSQEFVVEIGCNDGTALNFVKNKGIRHLGIDPSENVVKRAISKGVTVKKAFFTESLARDIVRDSGPASHVYAANVVCHIPDLWDFARGVSHLVGENGIFVFEEPYILDMLIKTSYDQIYDEHVYMFSINSVSNIFSKFGMKLFDAEKQSTHGGSMRYFLSRSDEKLTSIRLKRLMAEEEEYGVSKLENFGTFIDRCKRNKVHLVKLLNDLKFKGKTVAGYAATSKSTTVLNYCGIGSDLIQCIYDSTPEKIGCVTPGSQIPIKDQDIMRSYPPDYLVLFAWNHKEEILQKEKDRLPKHQRWIHLVPEVEVV